MLGIKLTKIYEPICTHALSLCLYENGHVQTLGMESPQIAPLSSPHSAWTVQLSPKPSELKKIILA